MSEKSLNEYYDRLYKAQDRVLIELERRGSPFYLTGGTALSRFHIHHRYSADLDFFTHDDIPFLTEVQRLITVLREAGFTIETERMSEEFSRFMLTKTSESTAWILKIDFVNERGTPRFGDFIRSEQYSRIDNMRNILSNKITALTRQEAKDVADIWFICKHLDFAWKEIIREAESKEAVEELLVERLLRTFPEKELEHLHWQAAVDFRQFISERERMIEDIICARRNSLFHLK